MGGNRLSGFSNKLEIIGDAFDPDYVDETEKRLNISYSWTCFNINNGDECTCTDFSHLDINLN